MTRKKVKAMTEDYHIVLNTAGREVVANDRIHKTFAEGGEALYGTVLATFDDDSYLVRWDNGDEETVDG